METVTETKPEHPMRAIKLAKVTVHIGVGKSGEMLEKAMKVLSEITGQKPCTKQAKMTVKEFGTREGEPIACLTTLRGEKASAFLKRARIVRQAGETPREGDIYRCVAADFTAPLR